MHGSTSPSKNGRSSYSQRQFCRTSATVSRACGDAGSSPKSRSRSRLGSVEVQGCPSDRSQPAPGKQAPPAHWPSGSRSASSRAPQPSVATRARSAATTSAGASARSRSTCQRIAGSASSSQSRTVTAGNLAKSGVPPHRARSTDSPSRRNHAGPLPALVSAGVRSRLAVVGIAVAVGAVAGTGTAAARPSDAQVGSAQQAADDAAAQVARMLVRLGDAQAAGDSAHAQAGAAHARYDATQADDERAQAAADTAQAAAQQAEQDLAGARAA